MFYWTNGSKNPECDTNKRIKTPSTPQTVFISGSSADLVVHHIRCLVTYYYLLLKKHEDLSFKAEYSCQVSSMLPQALWHPWISHPSCCIYLFFLLSHPLIFRDTEYVTFHMYLFPLCPVCLSVGVPSRLLLLINYELHCWHPVSHWQRLCWSFSHRSGACCPGLNLLCCLSPIWSWTTPAPLCPDLPLLCLCLLSGLQDECRSDTNSNSDDGVICGSKIRSVWSEITFDFITNSLKLTDQVIFTQVLSWRTILYFISVKFL